MTQERRRLVWTLIGAGALALLALPGALAQALPERPPPGGMTTLPANGSGRVLTTRLSGSSSATKLLSAVLLGTRDYFSGSLRVLNAYRDPADRSIQAAFSARLGSVAVLGLAGVVVDGAGARAVLLFDATRALPGSIERLVRVATGGGAAARAALTRATFPDGSGSIGLAPGWRITGSHKGTVDVLGPQGASLGLGGPTIVVPTSAAALFPGYLAVSTTDPVNAYVEIARQLGERAGQSVRVQVLDRRETPWQNGQAAFARYRVSAGGQSFEGFGLFAIMPYDTNAMLAYSSYVVAPSGAFASVLPTALEMWGSWSVNPAVFTERLMAAAKSMRETGDIVLGVTAGRQRAFESVTAGWSEYFRGVATLEDRGGIRSQVDQLFAAQVVRDDPANFRVLPASELLPR